MKHAKKIRIETTLGELISALWEETENLFKFKGNDKPMVVAYVLNELLMLPGIHVMEARAKRDSGKDPQS
jgi:hypothetical protein